jgi:hypothetical protein
MKPAETGRSRAIIFAFRARQPEEGPRLVHCIGKAGKATVQGDQIEKIAMLPGRAVGLMFN